MYSKSKAVLMAKIADAKGAEDIRVMNLRPLSTMTDFFVIMHGSSPPHVRALRDALEPFGAAGVVYPHSVLPQTLPILLFPRLHEPECASDRELRFVARAGIRTAQPETGSRGTQTGVRLSRRRNPLLPQFPPTECSPQTSPEIRC